MSNFGDDVNVFEAVRTWRTPLRKSIQEVVVARPAALNGSWKGLGNTIISPLVADVSNSRPSTPVSLAERGYA